ncbi:MAG: AAA family ATPase [Thermoguttaceae bacterium]|nr:AAA family ATPase [Thermoguttaceae bacterium]
MINDTNDNYYSDPPEIQSALDNISAKAAGRLSSNPEQEPPDAAQPAPASFDQDSPHAPGSMKQRARLSQQQREECSRRPIAFNATGATIYGNTPPPKTETVDEQKTLLPIVTRGDLVPDKQIGFLWKDRFPYQFGLIAGRQGLGKSMFVGYLAAKITNASVKSWLDGAPCPTGCVLFFTPEGGSSLTIQRIRNMGGNTKNIVFYSGLGSGRLRPDGTLDTDFDPVVSDTVNLTQAIDAAEKDTGQKVQLVVIDPITDFMGDIQQNNNAEVTRALRGLDYLAVERNICIIGVKHLNKNANTSAAVYNVGGSNAFTSKARFVYLLDQTPDSRKAEIEGDGSTGRRLILSGAKSNDFNIRYSIEYQLAGDDSKRVDITELFGDWTADSLQYELSQINGGGAKGRGRPADDDRNAEIEHLLASGKKPKEVMEEMRASRKTVYKAYNKLKEGQAESYMEFDGFGDDGAAD